MDGVVYYFTLEDYITKGDKNLICTSSLFQYESYRNWINLENLRNPNSYGLYLIILDANIKNRLCRTVNNRCKSNNDIYEACRRVVEERAELDTVRARVPELMDPMSYNTVLFIDTNDISKESNFNNLNKIKNFILSKTSK
jgi:hypothetical protein